MCPLANDQVVEEEELKSHLGDGIVQGISEAMIAFGEPLYFNHISKDMRYLWDLVFGTVYFLLDQLCLDALKRVC